MKFLTGLGRGSRIVLALAVAGAVFGIASAVQASIPDANGVIHGCYAKAGTPSQGDLRVSDSGNCKPTENPLSWNQAGVTGPTGPTGPSDAWYADSGGTKTGTGLTPLTVATVSLPAGNFTLAASGSVAVGTATGAHENTRCTLNAFATQTEDAFVSLWPGSSALDQATFALNRDVVGPTTVNLQCESDVAGNVLVGRIVATASQTLHGIAAAPVNGAKVQPTTGLSK